MSTESHAEKAEHENDTFVMADIIRLRDELAEARGVLYCDECGNALQRESCNHDVRGASVAALEAEHDKCLREWWLTPEFSHAEWLAGLKLKEARQRLLSERSRTATGAANVLISDRL